MVVVVLEGLSQVGQSSGGPLCKLENSSRVPGLLQARHGPHHSETLQVKPHHQTISIHSRLYALNE